MGFFNDPTIPHFPQKPIEIRNIASIFKHSVFKMMGKMLEKLK